MDLTVARNACSWFYVRARVFDGLSLCAILFENTCICGRSQSLYLAVGENSNRTRAGAIILLFEHHYTIVVASLVAIASAE